MRGILLAGATALILAGCATAYQEKGFTGGYSTTQLKDNMFRVHFNGNGYTSRQRAQDFTLLRSAELTLEKGFNYFAIARSDKTTTRGTITTPQTSTTNFNAQQTGNTVYGNATTTTQGGNTIPVTKPGTEQIIVCFQEKPEDVFTYDAKKLRARLKEKYGIE
ncbi:hypothetical protein AN478_02450 [Thiohalorhabdus denitrificans]|uniref:Lipoprotein n=1 Tax=Thiohalorhabdus denitrificans TaxID=381306 RepID=A0A0P9CQE8_9GAMM|nr:hypothetical protein [Thiohalorhabdus denitrificans]KPV41450.1 hypothetical protein AN478_02450 [Thiohalorhabdus denitrificans]SCY27805.1 hypothetical protein SAMN05661077_1683 [Thiohalorhabdus denitrificans]